MMQGAGRAMAAAARAARATRGFHGSAARRFAAEDAAVSSKVVLNLSAPTRSLFNMEPVELVNIPGMTGEYGVAADHAPAISELKPGLVQVFRTEGAEPESCFVAAGMAITHPDSTTDIAASDIATLDELDLAAAQAAYAETKRKLETLTDGTQEHAVAQIELDVYEAVCGALGAPM